MNGIVGYGRAVLGGILLLAIAVVGAGAGELPSSVIGSGGGAQSGTSHLLDFTVGQTSAGLMAGSGHHAEVGFWYLIELDAAMGVPPLLAPTRLDQNAPNPFNPSTSIRFSVGKAGRVDLKLYDVRGRMVAKLLDQEMETGEHSVVFEPRTLASGVYIYRLRTPDKVLTRRMTLVK